MSNISNKVKDVLTGRDHTVDSTTTTTTTHRKGAPGTGCGATTTDAPPNMTSGAYRSDVPHQHDHRIDTTSNDVGARTAGKAFGTEGYGSHQDSTNQGLHHTVNPDQAHTRHTGGGAYTSGTATQAGTYPGSTTTGMNNDRAATMVGQDSTHRAGPHRTDLGNKVDPRVDSDLDGSTTLGRDRTTTTTAGPHRTDFGNKVDPRVDSDLDGSTTLGRDRTTTTAGPHRTDVGNKVDPRVDSDLDGSTTLGRDRTTTTAGPHRTDVGNKVDPRVDSDLDGSRTLGRDRTTTTGNDYDHRRHHVGAPTTTTGTTAPTTSATGATGPAPNTAGPHKYDILNKLDPRVDSDLDGSKTIGGNTTDQTTRHGAY